jgi:hypothetical protein
MMPGVRRLLGDPAVCTWLLVTLAGVVAALVVGDPVWALVCWVAGGLAAVVVAPVRSRRGR